MYIFPCLLDDTLPVLLQVTCRVNSKNTLEQIPCKSLKIMVFKLGVLQIVIHLLLTFANNAEQK